MSPFLVILCDVLMVGVVLVVFALFHHVLPHTGKSLAEIVSILPIPQPSASAGASGNASGSASAGGSAVSQATPAATPALGDFSASFPAEDTGADAKYSYQSDNLRVAIDEVQKNGVTYYLADVWVRGISYFRTAFAGGQYGQGQREAAETIAEEVNAVFAVTGDYYSARSSGIVIRNGELYRDKPFEDVAVLYANGELATFHAEDFSLDDAIWNKAWQAWSFGPLLLKNGQPVTSFSEHIKRENPRCAIGYYEPGHYCLVVVDGRQPGYSEGMTLAQLSELFYSLGCKTAYNFDGGDTARMIFQGEVVNRPSGSRESSDILCFGVQNG